jgi:endonuclease/exonuclease/phosphatase family metal-dependent hydrolase
VGADDYDIVAVQEDFGYDGDFSAGLGMPFRTYGPQSAAFGDGLNVFSKMPLYNVAREGWNKKGGMLWEGDIVSQKGVMLAVVELAPGVYVDVYNLHADAYGGQESIDARYDNFRQTMDFINANSKEHPVIVTGDFNDAADSPALRQLTDKGLLHLTSDARGENGVRGTYRYQGEWGSLDHVLGSPTISSMVDTVFIHSPRFLLEKEPLYGGLRPRRTYNGIRYQPGYSDHLPLVVRLRLQP